VSRQKVDDAFEQAIAVRPEARTLLGQELLDAKTVT
jgi:hypothetical protein